MRASKEKENVANPNSSDPTGQVASPASRSPSSEPVRKPGRRTRDSKKNVPTSSLASATRTFGSDLNLGRRGPRNIVVPIFKAHTPSANPINQIIQSLHKVIDDSEATVTAAISGLYGELEQARIEIESLKRQVEELGRVHEAASALCCIGGSLTSNLFGAVGQKMKALMDVVQETNTPKTDQTL